MIDTHAHLDFSQFDADREKVIERFLAGGGKWLVNIGVNTERNQKALELAEKYEQIYCSLGYHPEELAEKPLKELLLEAEKFLREKGKEKKVVAIGEIGLDYFHNSQNKDDQKKLFVRQLEIAAELDLPVILHCRDAYEDVYKTISNFSAQGGPASGWQFPRFVLHCYGGNLAQTEKFSAFPNVYFSFTGNITFLKNKKSPSVPLLERGKTEEPELFEVVRRIPENRIMVETDCPFLAPQSQRGKRNEPSYVKMVIEKLAEIKGISFEKMEKITDQNAEEFFSCRG